MLSKLKIFCTLVLLFLSSLSNAYHLKKSSLVIDINSGRVLHNNCAHEARYPASLVKMMTLYLTFEKLSKKELKLDQYIYVSKKAASMPRTNMNLKAGSRIPVRKAILGLIVHSSNDAAVALAEAIGGTEKNFVKLMNNKAKQLKMNKTIYQNASGWHHRNQRSSAHDTALLAIALKKNFPKYFPFFSVTSFIYEGKRYHSHNHVMKMYQYANGLKTGFTNPSGFNLATTANKNGRELVGVVLGESTAKSRDKYMVKLLENCFKKVNYPATIPTLSANMYHSN